MVDTKFAIAVTSITPIHFVVSDTSAATKDDIDYFGWKPLLFDSEESAYEYIPILATAADENVSDYLQDIKIVIWD